MDWLLKKKETIKDLASLNDELDRWSGERLLEISSELLQIFISANFIGCVEVELELRQLIDSEFVFFKDASRENLSFDTNHPFKLTRLIELIWLSKLMILDRKERIANTYERNICACRCVQLWQCVLDEPRLELKQIAEQSENDIFNDEQQCNQLTSEFLLERVYAQLCYYEYDKAEKYLEDAIQKANLSMHLAGVLGKRTRFQTNNIAQLIAKASVLTEKVDENVASTPTVEETSLKLPTNVRLDDETLLENISILDDSGDGDDGTLQSVQLACILAKCVYEMRTQHNDELLFERCAAYIEKVLSKASNWAIHTSALLRRCLIEKQKRRRVQRACSQAEHIVNLVSGIDDSSSYETKRTRNTMVLASGLMPSWQVSALHAQILRSLGCTTEALRIYEKQEAWDDVIECYKSLGQLEKAEHLVRELIETHPNEALYYCLLGDITLQVSYYEQAIEVSHQRCSRAYRSLGELLMIRNQYANAYDNFTHALQLQPIQLGTWFNAGHCAWKLEKWRDAVSAYHRCVQLEPEHFEAWNNLSAAYIRLGEKTRAKRILQEALKFDYEHAKMWENYLLLCVDTCDCLDAIIALHRLMDLKKKYQDDEIIEILTQQIMKLDNKDSKDSLEKLKKEFSKLLARMTSTQTCSSKVWRCYASLVKPDDSDHCVEHHEKYIKFLERAYLADYNRQRWFDDEQLCCDVLNAALSLFKAKLKLVDQKMVMDEIEVSARSLITIVERTYGVDGNDCSNHKLQSALADLKRLIAK